MDGQVAAIRAALDAAGHSEIPICAYAAKYASGLYGPFRDAVDVTIADGGDRKGYQQDWRNAREAQREIDLDLAEGADIVMVKPAVTYLDVIAAARARLDVPIAAYHVSGEYAMIKAADANGLDRRRRRRARTAHRRQASRGRHDPHLLRPRDRRTAVAGLTPGVPMTTNRALFTRAQRVMPGGVNSPVRSFRSVGGTPYFVDTGRGPLRLGRRRAAATSTT